MNRRRLQRKVLPLTGMSLAAAAVVFLLGGELLRDPFDLRLAWRPGGAEVPRQALRPPGRTLEAHVRVAGARVGDGPEALGPAGAPAPAQDLGARLAVVDAELAGQQHPEDALARLLALLAAPQPGTPYEVETFRLAILARIGALPGPAADQALCACLDAGRPRPERLMAIEQLSTRPMARTYDLESIAAADHDLVVQGKARWALERLRGDTDRGGS